MNRIQTLVDKYRQVAMLSSLKTDNHQNLDRQSHNRKGRSASRDRPQVPDGVSLRDFHYTYGTNARNRQKNSPSGTPCTMLTQVGNYKFVEYKRPLKIKL